MKLFSVPVSHLRYMFAADLLRARGARNFVDLGCGEGGLLETFIKQAQCPLLPSLQSCSASCMTDAGAYERQWCPV